MIRMKIDPFPITRFLSDLSGSQVLVAACCHLNILEELSLEPQEFETLQKKLGLKDRPMMVIFPVLSAMGLVIFSENKKIALTELGSFLQKSRQPNLWDYLNLEASDAGVLEMADLLKNDGPLDNTGTAYCKDEKEESPMDDPEMASFFTKALAGRAEILAPIAVAQMPQKAHLLDVAGGSGFFTYEWLRAHPESTATLFDCGAVLDTAKEYLKYFCEKHKDDSIKNRVVFLAGDMMTDDLPQTDLLLTASIFHDWPEETIRPLVKRFSEVINPGGEFWIHDSFLNDDFNGPKATADYSAKLFKVTKGRCYSRQEHYTWLTEVGLSLGRPVDTAMDYSLISALKV
jgi:ubiquinone/menaquinone biosynthesis C-methylase UbiE